MNNRTPLIAITMSIITLVFLLTYPASSVKVPYVHSGTVYCPSTTFTTVLKEPTALSSNAVIGEHYTYYYSDVIVINGETCRIKGKVEYVTLTAPWKK